MAHIEIDTEDLTLFSNDIDKMNTKIENLKSIVNTKFSSVKEEKLYLEGFKNIIVYLENQTQKMNDFKSKLKKFQDEIISIEGKYSEKFNDFTIPSLQSGSSSLVVINQPFYNNITNPTTTNDSINNEEDTKNNNSTNTTIEKKETEKTDNNLVGVLAGVGGVLGVSGLAAAMINSSKDKDKDEEKDEESYIETKEV